MANNELYISDLNPMRFFERLTDNPSYHSKMWNDYPYKKTIHNWEEPAGYCRKWQTNDTIRLQFESNFDPIQIDVVGANGVVPGTTVLATQKLANKYQPGKFAYEAEISLAAVPPGDCYILTMTLASGLVYLDTDCFDVEVSHPDTKLFEYSNSRYHGDVIFETGIIFSARLECQFGKLITGSQDTIYDDQLLNPYLLSSKATRSYPLVIGNEEGVPESVDDLQSNIWTCNNVTIDGKSYAKGGDSKAEIKTEDNYPLYGITRIIREGINRGSKIIRTDADPNKKLMAVHVVNAGFFGDLAESGGTNIVTILSKEP